MKKCFYCGEYANTKDHIIPVSFYYNGGRKGKHLTAEYGKENLIDSCHECNCIANNKIFNNKYEKKDYIQERLKIKYRKIINSPFWSDEEINEMGRTLRKEIIIQQLARKWILNRLSHPVYLYPVIEFNRELEHFMNKEL